MWYFSLTFLNPAHQSRGWYCKDIPPSEPEAENLSVPYAHSHISFNFRTNHIFQRTANNCKATSAMAFAEISEENIKDLLSTKDSKETKRAVKRGVKLFRDYLTNKGVSSDFQNFAKCELNEHLRTFYASARKKDGDMMKTNSLTSLKYGISKYLKDTLEIDIKNDSEFSTSNTVYSAVVTDLKKKGLGSVDHKPAICPEDLFKIYDPSNVALNPNTLTGLLNKTWFDVMTFLCRRGRENL